MLIHDVPYRSILPEKLDGLLIGGRCISATHTGAAAGKSMGNCMATGHAAGVAAALSSEKNIVPRDLKVPELQARLRADGVDFDLGNRVRGFGKYREGIAIRNPEAQASRKCSRVMMGCRSCLRVEHAGKPVRGITATDRSST